MLSARFEVRVSLLLAPAGADKRGPKAPFPLVENAGIQPAIRKRVLLKALYTLATCEVLSKYFPLVACRTCH